MSKSVWRVWALIGTLCVAFSSGGGGSLVEPDLSDLTRGPPITNPPTQRTTTSSPLASPSLPLTTQVPTFSVFSSLPVMLDLTSISPNLTLSCSASVAGTFRWQWTAPDGSSPSEETSFDATRNSSALFTRISGDMDGLFRCQATNDILARSASHSIAVDLRMKLEALPPISMLNIMTLACEIYGYFPPDLPEIEWLLNNGDLVDSTSYEVTTKEGSRYIQNGGNDVIPSVISELEVQLSDSSVLGQYSCQIPGHATVNVTLIGRIEAETESDQQVADIIIIAAPVAGGVVAIAVTIIIIAIIIVSCQARKKKQVPITLNAEPALYETPITSSPVYEIPVATKDVEAIMTQSIAYGVSTFAEKSAETMTSTEAHLLHTREDKNFYDNELNLYDNEQEKNLYDNEQEKNLYDNEQPIYQNEQSRYANAHYGDAYEQSHEYI